MEASCNRGHSGHRGALSIDNTTLCSWGANNQGQLGQGHTEDQLLPTNIQGRLLPQEVDGGISRIGGGGGFSFIVTGTGCILTCGNNDRGQLGKAQTEQERAPRSVNFMTCSTLLGVKIVKASSGWDFMLALSDQGKVYSWGSNSFGQLGRQLDGSGSTKQSSTPGEVNFQSESFQRDIAAGLRHVLSLSTDDNVYAWGHGKKGQLGVEVKDKKEAKAMVTIPQKVPISSIKGTKAVFAGMYHSGILTDSSGLLLWGSNIYGQCCIDPNTTSCVRTPTLANIPCKEDECVIEVHSGWTHLVARTDKGNLYSWGRGNLGQLGRSCDAGFTSTPGLVEGLTNVTMHACGSEHNIALSESRAYTWGWNEHGICGTSDEVSVPLPHLVSSFGQDSVITLVASGTGHTFCILTSHNKGSSTHTQQ